MRHGPHEPWAGTTCRSRRVWWARCVRAPACGCGLQGPRVWWACVHAVWCATRVAPARAWLALPCSRTRPARSTRLPACACCCRWRAPNGLCIQLPNQTIALPWLQVAKKLLLLYVLEQPTSPGLHTHHCLDHFMVRPWWCGPWCAARCNQGVRSPVCACCSCARAAAARVCTRKGPAARAVSCADGGGCQRRGKRAACAPSTCPLLLHMMHGGLAGAPQPPSHWFGSRRHSLGVLDATAAFRSNAHMFIHCV